MSSRDDLYPVLKNKLCDMAQLLLELPDSGVWIHEKSLSKLLKLPSGVNFGPRKALTFLIRGIQQGYWGDRRADHIKCNFGCFDLAEGESNSRVVYQKFGKPEAFVGGKELEYDMKKVRPRWFKAGEPLMDVRTQLQIAEALLGETPGISEEVEQRRQRYHTSFLKCADEDGGYGKYDVPTVAYEFRDIWGEEVLANKKYVKDGYVQRRAFKPEDLIKIEYHMRMILVASNRIGKLHICRGQLVPHTSIRSDRESSASELASVITKLGTQSAGKSIESPKSLPTPKQLTYGSVTKKGGRSADKAGQHTLPDCLLLKQIDCTTELGYIIW